MNVKNVVKGLMDDIVNGVSISQILLKAQIVAFNVDDGKFSQLVRNEQQGYSQNEDIPDYRKVKTLVKATFVDKFHGLQTVEVHSEAVGDKRIRDLLTYAYVTVPLVQVENLYANAENAMASIPIPIFAYPTIKSLYQGYDVEVYTASHYFPKEALLSVVDTFKAQLLDLLMQFDKKLDWNMELSTGDNKSKVHSIVNNVYNIHAVVANTGNGTVETNNINTTIEK